MNIKLSEDKNLPMGQIIELYSKNKWSSANKPKELLKALENSHTLITAWEGNKLVGLGNAISDGHLVVYYPHLLILPSHQGYGIGKMIMNKMQEIYDHIHMQMLVADKDSVNFYEKVGFSKAGQTTPMWIYSGDDH